MPDWFKMLIIIFITMIIVLFFIVLAAITIAVSREIIREWLEDRKQQRRLRP